MSYKNVKAHALGHLVVTVLGHLRATTRSSNSCLGKPCRRATLGQLLCDMSCNVNDNHSKQKLLIPYSYLKSR